MSNLLQAAVIFLPPLNEIFHTVPIAPREVFGIGATASLVIWIEEIRKYLLRRRDRGRASRPPTGGTSSRVGLRQRWEE